MKLLDEGKGGCSLIAQALDRAEERDHETRAAYLVELLSRCDAQSDAPRLWLSKHGDLPGVKAWLEQALPLSSDPVWLRSERAEVALALGSAAAASAELSALARLAPGDVNLRIRLADAELAKGEADRARTVLAEALALYPGRQEVRQAARLVGLALPLDEYRVDGRSVIRDYLASGRHYPAPAVVVLDRAVEKALPDGAGIVLTHSITQVLSKDAIEHVGEVTVPEGAEVLALRTHKADGTVREAEEIAGKGAISAPNLAVGDFVEAETREFKEARAAVAPGFVAERFYFQSFDAPLDRSEYVLIAPAGAELKNQHPRASAAARDQSGARRDAGADLQRAWGGAGLCRALGGARPGMDPLGESVEWIVGARLVALHRRWVRTRGAWLARSGQDRGTHCPASRRPCRPSCCRHRVLGGRARRARGRLRRKRHGHPGARAREPGCLAARARAQLGRTGRSAPGAVALGGTSRGAGRAG